MVITLILRRGLLRENVKSKIRADAFFRLKQGEFVNFVDGKDKKFQFRLSKIKKQFPNEINVFTDIELKKKFQQTEK